MLYYINLKAAAFAKAATSERCYVTTLHVHWLGVHFVQAIQIGVCRNCLQR